MNVLAPVAQNGRLQVSLAGDTGAVQGFQTGEFRVSDPETRKRAMHDRVGGATCPWLTLEEVVSRDSRLAQAVGRPGAAGRRAQPGDRRRPARRVSAPPCSTTCCRSSAPRGGCCATRACAGSSSPADHGFLLLDDGAAAAQAHGRRIDPKRRHVFSPVAADHAGEVRVALADLGYEGADTST